MTALTNGERNACLPLRAVESTFQPAQHAQCVYKVHESKLEACVDAFRESDSVHDQSMSQCVSSSLNADQRAMHYTLPN